MIMLHQKCKMELQSFLGIVKYLNTFSPTTSEVCKLLRKLTSVKMDWAWNGMYQELYYKAKNLMKKDTYMKFYNTTKSLYLETDSSGISLGLASYR